MTETGGLSPGARVAGAALVAASATACLMPGAAVSEPGSASVVPPSVERTLQEDLHRLLRAQERYRSTLGSYSTNLIDLRFAPSRGVRVRVPEADSTGFSAVATRSPYECALFVGDARPPRPYLEAPTVIGCSP